MIYIEKKQDLKNMAIWFTGLSGSGKTTLAKEFQCRMKEAGLFCMVLDGDEVRRGINAGLGFTKEDRFENIRRIAEVAKLFVKNGIDCVVSTISPYTELSEMARRIIGKEYFAEIFINAPLSVCEERDVKGLYKCARQNILSGFTGIQDIYVPPTNPDLEINTDKLSLRESLEKLTGWFEHKITILDPA